MMSDLSTAQGTILVRLARETITMLVGKTPQPRLTPEELAEPIFQERRGVFVTLKKKGALRGCIGSLVSTESIITGIRSQAENAALHDSRFTPLQATELSDITIEISILTEPSPLAFKGADELLTRLRPHVDGVILSFGRHQSTFLPQVWDQLPAPEEFLGHLAMKAGLDRHGWRRDGVEIATYQVQHFSE